MRSGRPTIRDVAKLAGVSTATVSRIINDSSLVSPATAIKVRRVIQQLNYHPDTQARSLVSGRSRILGLIISDIANPFFPELVKGFENLALQNNYEVILSNTNYDPARMATCVRRLLERKADSTSNYDDQANQNLAKNLRGKLLLGHGTMDNNVPPYNTLLVVNELIKANKDFDLLMLPNRGHGFGAEAYMVRRRWDYFVRYLLGADPPREYEMHAPSSTTPTS